MIYVSTCCLKGNDDRHHNGRFHRSIMDVVNKYISLGIKGIELGSAHEPFRNFKILKKLKDENSLNYIFHTNFPTIDSVRMVNLASTDEKFRKKCVDMFLKNIEFLNYLEGKIYSLHPGQFSDMVIKTGKKINISNRETATLNSIDSLQKISDKAREYGIKIAIENSSGTDFDSVFVTVEDFKRIRKETKVMLLLDIGHLDSYIYHNNLTKIERKNIIKRFEPYIVEMHCHKALKNDEHLLPEKKLFNDFSKTTLRKAALTLESNNLDEKGIMKGIKVLKSLY